MADSDLEEEIRHEQVMVEIGKGSSNMGHSIPENSSSAASRVVKQTGPRTARGKAASSQNAVKHGLRSKDVVIRGESVEEFDNLLQDVRRDQNPVGALWSLQTLVHSIKWNHVSEQMPQLVHCRGLVQLPRRAWVRQVVGTWIHSSRQGRCARPGAECPQQGGHPRNGMSRARLDPPST